MNHLGRTFLCIVALGASLDVPLARADKGDHSSGHQGDHGGGGGPCAAFKGEQRHECKEWVKHECSLQSPLSKDCAHHLAEFQEDCASGTVACASGEALACVDLSTDAHNCGACGNACSGACTAGSCGPPACNSRGASSFSDNYNRADGPLTAPYLTSGLPIPNAAVQSQMVCGQDHDAAFIQIAPPSSYLSVDFDWVGSTTQALESLAVAADLCGNTFVFAGTDGGVSPPLMQIQAISGVHVRGPISIAIQPGVTYHTSAAFYNNGDVTVKLTQGGTVIGTLAANIGMSINYHQAGEVIGRQAGNTTCNDNLVIQVH